MKLDLDGVLLIVSSVALAPVIADCVCENISVFAEARCDDAATDFRVALEAVLCVLVPEMESAIGTGGGESAVLWVEGNGVYRKDLCGFASVGVGLAVALERKVEAARVLDGLSDP